MNGADDDDIDSTRLLVRIAKACLTATEHSQMFWSGEVDYEGYTSSRYRWTGQGLRIQIAHFPADDAYELVVEDLDRRFGRSLVSSWEESFGDKGSAQQLPGLHNRLLQTLHGAAAATNNASVLLQAALRQIPVG